MRARVKGALCVAFAASAAVSMYTNEAETAFDTGQTVGTQLSVMDSMNSHALDNKSPSGWSQAARATAGAFLGAANGVVEGVGDLKTPDNFEFNPKSIASLPANVVAGMIGGVVGSFSDQDGAKLTSEWRGQDVNSVRDFAYQKSVEQILENKADPTTSDASSKEVTKTAAGPARPKPPKM